MPSVTAAGRASRLGEQLDCVRCDRFELPDACVAFERTPEFTEDSIPNGLRARHVTVADVWGRIVVTAGALLTPRSGNRPARRVVQGRRFSRRRAGRPGTESC